MENILDAIPVWIMLSIGFALLAVELITATFIVMFFGLAFILVGVIGFFVDWSSGEFQLLIAMLLGGVLTFALRGLVTKGLSKEDLPLETMQTGDTGQIEVHDGHLRVNYKGTTWAFKNMSDDEVRDGDEVIVTELKNNTAYITKA
jgi:membrane protein implicated in regulation of membrane protease activity